MSKTVEETFKSGPEEVKAGIMEALKAKVPDFVHLLKWNPDGRKASGSKYGAKGTLELEGEGPTTATVTFSIGFPASMKYSEEDAAQALREAIRDLKKRVP
jgi:hypothetical protein